MDILRSTVRRFGAPLCALLLMLGVVFFPNPQIRPPLKLALSLWPSAEAFTFARDVGLLPKDKVHVIELPWASAVQRTFDDDVVDVAVLTLDGALQPRASARNVRVLMVLDESTGGDALISQPQITQIRDLKGKKVGVDFYGVGGVSGVGMYLLINALEHAGMTLRDIQAVPMIQPEIESMFQEGRIDAAVASEPWLTRLGARTAYHQLYDSSELKVPIMRLLVASEQASKEQREVLPLLLKACVKTTGQIRSEKYFNGKESVLRRMNMDEQQYAKCLRHWKPADKQRNAELLSGKDPGLMRMARIVLEQMRRNGISQASLPNDEWIEPEFHQEAWP